MNVFLWAILAGCVWGIVPILEKVGLTKVEPFVGLFYRCLGVVLGIVLLGVFIVKPHQIRSVDMRTALILVLSGFLASFVAQIMFYHALKFGEVSKVVPIAGAFPFIAFILGIVILGESLTLVKAAGMLRGLVVVTHRALDRRQIFLVGQVVCVHIGVAEDAVHVAMGRGPINGGIHVNVFVAHQAVVIALCQKRRGPHRKDGGYGDHDERT